MQFLSTDRTRIAAFELKGPFNVPVKPDRLPTILADFEKQRVAAARSPQTEHHVVLVPFGKPADISQWVDSALGSALASQYPDVQLCDRIGSLDVPLNYDSEVLRVLTIRVASRERCSESLKKSNWVMRDGMHGRNTF